MLEDLKKYIESNQATLPEKGYKGLNFFGKIKFYGILKENNKILEKFYLKLPSEPPC